VLLGATVLGYRTVFVYDLRPGECPAIAPRPLEGAIPRGARLSVMSYNIEGHAALVRAEHLREIARVILARRPDVVTLQEVHRHTWQSRFHDQAAELAALTGMQASFGPSLHALGGEFGNAVLTRGRVVSARVVPLPSFGEPRSMLATTVDLGGNRIDVYVAHLAAWGAANHRVRALQVRCLAAHLRAGHRPFVLGGDLNTTPEAPDLSELAEGGFARLCGVASEPTHAILDRRLDYIYADPRFSVVDAAVLRTGPSDHWPIAATLAWQGTARHERTQAR
jgi:endonuclease/exonuclease/phosphatase family metal-dependent hydrolase